jgi:hypothetical protein
MAKERDRQFPGSPPGEIPELALAERIYELHASGGDAKKEVLDLLRSAPPGFSPETTD